MRVRVIVVRHRHHVAREARVPGEGWARFG